MVPSPITFAAFCSAIRGKGRSSFVWPYASWGWALLLVLRSPASFRLTLPVRT
jgi:hypothetical protein